MYISMYEWLYSGHMNIRQPVVTKTPEEVSAGLPLIEDARDITLAQYEPQTKDLITAHNLKDYRRKTFNLVLLPKVNVLFDKYLEGCKFYEERLHHESPYS